MRRLAICALVVLGVVAVLAAATPAGAHAPDRAATGRLAPLVGAGVQPAAPTASMPVEVVATVAQAPPAAFWLPLLILTAVLIVASWSRRAVVSLLIALVATFAFEAALHSVHHLGEQRAATRCVVESVSANLSGAVGESMTIPSPAATVEAAPRLEPTASPRRSPRPDRGRAPPFLA